MDPWVNSLVQSPLVRSLNTVPSRMSSFAHGVKDNVPPFSFSKVKVQAYSRPATGQPAGVHKFRVPQYGLLDRAYMRVRMTTKQEQGAVRANAFVWPSDPDVLATAASSSWNFAGALTTMSLQTRNKIVETLHAEAIPSEVQKMPEQHRKFFERGMVGFAAGIAASGAAQSLDVMQMDELWDPSAKVTRYTCDTAAGGVTVTTDAVLSAPILNRHNHADFLVPLPFSVLAQLKDNFQTRFVEDLEIHVGTKPYANVHGLVPNTPVGEDGYVVELVLIYHNFHDIIENSIRDQNYKRGFPASIYSHDTIQETTVSAAAARCSIELKSNNLATELVLVERSTATPLAGSAYALGLPLATASKVFKITLSGSGRELWSTLSSELLGPDTQDYSLADGHPWGGDVSSTMLTSADIAWGKQPVPIIDPLLTGVNPTADRLLVRKLNGGVLLGFSKNMLVLRFGFQAHSEFYTGGLALQTISNPTLTIESLDDATYFDSHSFSCYVKYSNMTRIDSDTGIITRTLDV